MLLMAEDRCTDSCSGCFQFSKKRFWPRDSLDFSRGRTI